MSADELRQARAYLLRVAELPAPAVVAFVGGLRLVAFHEPARKLSASARVAVAGGCKPVPTLASRERVAA